MPFVQAEVLTATVALLAAGCDIATVVAPEASPADRTNPDVVKAILAMAEDGQSGRALYFTRSTLYGDAPIWRHIGIYGYQRAALKPSTPPRPRRWRSARSWSSCGPWSWASLSMRRWSRPRRSRSTPRPISKPPGKAVPQ
jgi:hypothetical protein